MLIIETYVLFVLSGLIFSYFKLIRPIMKEVKAQDPDNECNNHLPTSMLVIMILQALAMPIMVPILLLDLSAKKYIATSVERLLKKDE